jgi:TolB-like protein
LIADVRVWDAQASTTVSDAPAAAPGTTPAAAPSDTPAAARHNRLELNGRTSASRGRLVLLATVIAALSIAVALALLLHGRATTTNHNAPAPANAPSKSVAVLPFLDLTTQDMNEEYFADGMTEELIDRLSKIGNLRVPSATSSFYFKGKQIKVADIAKSLGVTYVLDGSIRKSDNTLRVAARLLRADDGYVIWSETYDRPLDNKLKVQDEIAGEVAKALKASIN